MLETVSCRRTNKTVYSARCHVIWCPKYRRRVLVGPVEVRLGEIVGAAVAEHGGTVIETEVMPDHVHLLAEIPPAVALSGFVQRSKGRSARVLRQELPHLGCLPGPWSPSWFVSTVGGAPLEVVRRYVENHKQAA